MKQFYRHYLRTNSLMHLAGSLCFCSLLLLVSCSDPNLASNPVHSSAQFSVPFPIQPIRMLHMLDATTGWAVTASTILYTTDGGLHWQNISPPVAQNYGQYKSIPYFLNETTAWVWQYQTNGTKTALYRTTNRGRTWQASTIPTGSIEFVSFVDAQKGWILSNAVTTRVHPEATVTLLHTIDGGETWTKVANITQATDQLGSTYSRGKRGSLPFVNAYTGLHFVNATDGWLSGTITTNGFTWLYTTYDGGSTWEHVSLPLPTQISKSELIVWPPTFFTFNDGILAVTAWSPVSLATFVTHDGGRSWQHTGLLYAYSPPNLDMFSPTGSPTFVDLLHGWVGAYDGKQNSLYATSDGGQHWTEDANNQHLWLTATIDFVTSTLWWAVDTSNPASLSTYKTVDGGRTWEVMAL